MADEMSAKLMQAQTAALGEEVMAQMTALSEGAREARQQMQGEQVAREMAEEDLAKHTKRSAETIEQLTSDMDEMQVSETSIHLL